MKQLVVINRKCDKRNRFYDITNKTEEEIQLIKNKYQNKNLWMFHIREI